MTTRLLLLVLLTFTAFVASAQAPEPTVPAAAQAMPLDPVAATRAWIDTLPAAQRAKTDAYFEGGYWLLLWSALIGVASAWLLLASGVSSKLRDAAERITRRRPLQVAIYAVGILTAFTLLALPWTIYTEYVREHQYGLSNQTLGAWLGEQAIGLGLTLLFGALVLMVVYAVIRRAPRSWWQWGAGVVTAFAAFGSLVYPPFIAPLFNDYKPIANAAVRDEVLSLARAHGVPAEEVYEFNASKQHSRISANVAGLGGTMRIALNDNLLLRGSRGEIRMVMAHEIGHYVLNHAWKGLVFVGLVTLAMFAFARWAFAWAHARWGARWGVRDVADTAGLPILVAAFTVFQLLATPINNTLTRVQEIEADQFGLAAGRDPDAEAAVILKLGEYRKMEPGPIEELIFYTHPSGWRRIENAMRWKAEQQQRQTPSAAAR
jgi:STE24 endopeptidase